MGPVKDVPGLWDGKDSGIVALHCGTHGICPGCPSVSRDSGMGMTVGLWTSTVGHMGPVRDVTGVPGRPEQNIRE